MSAIEVSQLCIYPAKSMRQIDLDSSAVDRFGLHNDRRWMVVDDNGLFITQRKYARMCLINVAIVEGCLVLQAAGMPSISVSNGCHGKQLSVKVWTDQCSAYDCGDSVASWLSRFIGISSRLVYFPEDENRLLDQAYSRPEEFTAFSDGFPILLISQASLDDLNSRLEVSVPISRFRPNIVVTGTDPYAEDTWKQIRIGELILRLVKPCSRCIIPCIDIQTGESSAEPVKTLSSYRKRENKIFFGQNVIVNGTGQLQVGMAVEIIA